MSITDYADKIAEESFGLSAYLLFVSVKCASSRADLDGLKEDFLNLVEYLLMRKKIMLITPGVDVTRTSTHVPKFNIYDKEAQWNASPQNAVRYLREHWPKNLVNAEDKELTYYLYEMPGIIWIANDGSLHAS